MGLPVAPCGSLSTLNLETATRLALPYHQYAPSGTNEARPGDAVD